MTGYDAPPPGHGQRAGHYGVPGQGHYAAAAAAAAMTHHSGGAFARPLPMGAPVLAPAGFNHHPQHTGHHQHGRIHSQNQNQSQNLNLNQNQNHALAMAASAYMASDEELAHLQKLSSEYEPEATVSLLVPHCTALYCTARLYRPPLTITRAR
jgi:hypothetical protein